MENKILGSRGQMLGLKAISLVFLVQIIVFHFSNYRVGGTGIVATMMYFFIMPGFLLQLACSDSPVLKNKTSIKGYYLRIAALLLPAYILTELLGLIFAGDMLQERLLLLPLRLVGMQTAFSDIQFFLGATWYVSSLLGCCIVFPLFNYLILLIEKKRVRIWILILLIGFYLYCNLLSIDYNCSIYYNIAFRTMEMVIGMLFASVIRQRVLSSEAPNLFSAIFTVIYFIALLGSYGSAYMNTLKIFVILLLIDCASQIRSDRMRENHPLVKFLNYLCFLSMDLYLMQDMILNWEAKKYWETIEDPQWRYTCMAGTLILISVVVYGLYTRNVRKLILKKLPEE